MAFLFRLETAEGVPADPSTLEAAVPDWRPGHLIHFGRNKTFRVVGTRTTTQTSLRCWSWRKRLRDCPRARSRSR